MLGDLPAANELQPGTLFRAQHGDLMARGTEPFLDGQTQQVVVEGQALVQVADVDGGPSKGHRERSFPVGGLCLLYHKGGVVASPSIPGWPTSA